MTGIFEGISLETKEDFKNFIAELIADDAATDIQTIKDELEDGAKKLDAFDKVLADKIRNIGISLEDVYKYVKSQVEESPNSSNG